MKRLARTGFIATAVVALAGCGPDLGLDGKVELLPYEVAKTAPPKPIVYYTMFEWPTLPPGIPEEPVEFAGLRWRATGTAYALPDAYVRPVGSAGGLAFHALRWDEEPYNRLLLRREGAAWQELLKAY